jgi:hypothetical protein
MDSMAVVPESTMRSAQEIESPYFCLMGHSSRRALSRLVLSGQERSGSNLGREGASGAHEYGIDHAAAAKHEMLKSA